MIQFKVDRNWQNTWLETVSRAELLDPFTSSDGLFKITFRLSFIQVFCLKAKESLRY